jgi:hypothetical protein
MTVDLECPSKVFPRILQKLQFVQGYGRLGDQYGRPIPLPARFAFAAAIAATAAPRSTTAAASTLTIAAASSAAEVTAAAAAKFAAAKAAAPGRPLAAGPSLVDVEITAAVRRSVQLLDRLIGFLIVWHFHEAKASWTPRLAVRDQANPVDRPELFEELTHFVFRSLVIQIPNKDVLHK